MVSPGGAVAALFAEIPGWNPAVSRFGYYRLSSPEPLLFYIHSEKNRFLIKIDKIF